MSQLHNTILTANPRCASAFSPQHENFLHKCLCLLHRTCCGGGFLAILKLQDAKKKTYNNKLSPLSYVIEIFIKWKSALHNRFKSVVSVNVTRRRLLLWKTPSNSIPRNTEQKVQNGRNQETVSVNRVDKGNLMPSDLYFIIEYYVIITIFFGFVRKFRGLR